MTNWAISLLFLKVKSLRRGSPFLTFTRLKALGKAPKAYGVIILSSKNAHILQSHAHFPHPLLFGRSGPLALVLMTLPTSKTVTAIIL